jgi:two-component system, OmpR family, KDP operon response regulator KdpE
MTRVLVVDDEPQILRALRTSLKAAGYEVATVATATEALATAALKPPQAMILDLVLPDGTGTQVCREFRKWSASPVIMLSAVEDERDKVDALDAGADDYVTKPVGIEELLARLRAALRRTLPDSEPLVVVGNLEIDLGNRALRVAGEPVHLTPHQFDLLGVFARNPGKLLTHRMLLQQVWGPRYGDESSLLRVHIAQLRRKIEPDPARPRHLVTEPGAGYRLVQSLYFLNDAAPRFRAAFTRKTLRCRSWPILGQLQSCSRASRSSS